MLPSDSSSPSSPSGTHSKLSPQQISGVEISCEEIAALSWQRGLGSGDKAAPAGLAKLAVSNHPITTERNSLKNSEWHDSQMSEIVINDIL